MVSFADLVYRFWSRRSQAESARENLQTDRELFARDGAAWGGDHDPTFLALVQDRLDPHSARIATWALARQIAARDATAPGRGVVVAYSGGDRQAELAFQVAFTLAAGGVVGWVWDRSQPASRLSYAIRELGAAAGVMVAAGEAPDTAGLTIYGEDGTQVTSDELLQIAKKKEALPVNAYILTLAHHQAVAEGLMRRVPAEVDHSHLQRLIGLLRSAPADRRNVPVICTASPESEPAIIGTPIAAGGFPVQPTQTAALQGDGSAEPDVHSQLETALAQARATGAELIIATEANFSGISLMVRNREGDYRTISGHQLGVILAAHLSGTGGGNDRESGLRAVVKSLSATNLVVPLCWQAGVSLLETHGSVDVLAHRLNRGADPAEPGLVLGLTESGPLLLDAASRACDGVLSALMIADAAALAKRDGRTLWDVLELTWEKWGHFREETCTLSMAGAAGATQMAAAMHELRTNPPSRFGSYPLASRDDYEIGAGFDLTTASGYALPPGRADLLHYRFGDGGSVLVRPSPAEGKLTASVSMRGDSAADAEGRFQEVMTAVLRRLRRLPAGAVPDAVVT